MTTTTNDAPKVGIFGHITAAFDSLVRRYLPDPFVIVMILTIAVFAAGLLFTDAGPVELTRYWGEGFWNLLKFAMQMMLVLVTGYILASSPLFKRILGRIARIASTPGQAIILVTVVALAASWINWGFGLVIGALFA